MSQIQSKLGAYIQKLMHDDAALRRFLIDPITEAEEKHGLSKADRAVLRRTVFHLSNNSKNGYSLERHLGSYRRSLRLLQNVLDVHGANMVMDHAAKTENSDTGTMYSYSLLLYYPSKITTDTDFSCKTNESVDGFGGPYSKFLSIITTQLSTNSATIQQVMNQMKSENKLSFNTEMLPGGEEGAKPYVSVFEINGMKITADLSNSCYDLSNSPPPDFVFWFYSVDGRPNTDVAKHPGGLYGSDGQSFADFTVNPGSVIIWQLIAPDSRYGFQPCPPPPATATANS